MELHFQKQEKQTFPATKQSAFRNRSANKNKFVGVRQRPSGKWVAEIKNTTQKIRMWLGTFDTAEEAARAYDEAACLLRGSNTRTNFVDASPANSPLSLKIRNLLNQKKASKQQNLSFTTTTTKAKAKAEHQKSSSPPSTNKEDTINMFDDGYKPDMRQCIEGGLEVGCSQFDQIYTSDFERLVLTQDGFEVPKRIGLGSDMGEANISEFEHMKVERQISASLYAMNGVSKYWENVHDSGDAAFWDLPMLCQMFCPS